MNEMKLSHIVKANKYPEKRWTLNILKTVVFIQGCFNLFSNCHFGCSASDVCIFAQCIQGIFFFFFFTSEYNVFVELDKL